eukprot:CAMPEP_0196757728 /NCGR_PEP_ID=MMETSP1091-20130531/103815_1 /TAXON_ID=302021 /ORGANISM="Rhodomonas sp., Strain CCMP768" /LENGTH=387 /DNA_ID=CAMNT_0042106513 /DNA_START=35 /DNA_END=1201 /DNA_ORIENTATION=-
MMKPNSPETIAHLDKQNEANQKHPLVHAVAQFLQATVEYNERRNRPSIPELKKFEAAEAPPLSPAEYVRRLMKYGGISPACLVIGVIYLERMKPKVSEVWLTSKNIQRLYLVAVMEAAKFWEDFYYDNNRWAQIGGVTLAEINKLELEFLSLTNFSLQVTTEQYDQFAAAIMASRPLTGLIASGMSTGRDAPVGFSVELTKERKMSSSPDYSETVAVFVSTGGLRGLCAAHKQQLCHLYVIVDPVNVLSKTKVSEVWLTSKNIQRLYLVAVMEAAKFWEDFYYDNNRWAQVGGVTLAEINKLELEFLSLTNFSLQVTTEQYDQFAAAIMASRPLTGLIASGMSTGRDAPVGFSVELTKERKNSSQDDPETVAVSCFSWRPARLMRCS